MKLLRYGVVPYGQALALQMKLRDRLLGPEADQAGYLVCLEHAPVITLGRRGKVSDLFAPQWLKDNGVEVFKIDRGGEATYHGPGQLVVYPVVRLEALEMGVVDLIRGMAASLAAVLQIHGLEASYDNEHPGLWTRAGWPTPRKIASVGMRVSRGVTTHGAAINLTNDLTPFTRFVACGMPEVAMTRLRDHIPAESAAVSAFRALFLEDFSRFLARPFEPAEVELPPKDEWHQPEVIVEP